MFELKNVCFIIDGKMFEEVYDECVGIYVEFGKIVCIFVGFVCFFVIGC